MVNSEKVTNINPDIEELDNYLTKEGIVPFLDHPNLVANKKIPKYYRAYYTLQAVISDYQRGIITEEHILILKYH